MKINRKQKLQIATGAETMQPLLQHVNLRQDGVGWVLEATDGHIAVAIPVEIEPHDHVGLIPARAFREVCTRRRKNAIAPEIRCWSSEVEFRAANGDKITMDRPVDLPPFPDVIGKIKQARDKYGAPMRIKLNAKHLHRLASALGSDAVILEIFALSPVVVTSPDRFGIGIINYT